MEIMREITNSTLTKIHNHPRTSDDNRDKLAKLNFTLITSMLSAIAASIDIPT